MKYLIFAYISWAVLRINYISSLLKGIMAVHGLDKQPNHKFIFTIAFSAFFLFVPIIDIYTFLFE